jgi:uncharacterized protein
VGVVPNVRIPLRDGINLSADIYRPDGLAAAPVLLTRTPYGKQHPTFVRWARHFAQNGFAVVVQDVRGRWESEGEWYPFVNEGSDGVDTIDWVAGQPWCDGAVGMIGGSYAAWTQWAAAREHPPALKTLASRAAIGRWFEEWQFSGGILGLQFLQWLNMVGGRTNQDNSLIDWAQAFEHLPLRTIDQAINRPLQIWQDALDHPRFDDYWQRLRLDDEHRASQHGCPEVRAARAPGPRAAGSADHGRVATRALEPGRRLPRRAAGRAGAHRREGARQLRSRAVRASRRTIRRGGSA